MAGHTENVIVINAPMDLLWEMTSDVVQPQHQGLIREWPRERSRSAHQIFRRL
jgi:hypothetical protein